MGWPITRLLFSSSLLLPLSVGFRINPNLVIARNRDRKAFVLSRASTISDGRKVLFFNVITELNSPRFPTLFAKPKGGMNDAVLAALEALDEQADQPLSLKELKQLEKKKAKEAKQQKQQSTADAVESVTLNNLEKKQHSKSANNIKKDLSKQQDVGLTEVGELSSKKESKLSEKKKKKKVELDEEDSELEVAAPSAVSEEASTAQETEKTSAGETQKQEEEEVTLEDRIRKERPPPRIRVMEGVQPGYVSLRLEDVSVTFRNQHVLKSVTWGVETGDRVGLVGANGGGKTTQLRILSGEMEPTSGDVVKSNKDLRVSILRQEFVDELDLERPLFDEFMSVFSEENQILLTLREVEAELEQMTSDDIDADRMQQILDRMADLQAKADAREVYALDSRVQKVMDLMGFSPDESKMPVKMFSGGWKMRIGLGKVLLKDPNVLLLDEPTNHLDLESVEWLEDFLRNQNIPMVIVSHDREFLDQICTKIVDVEGGIASEYDGNYSKFLKLKKARMDAWTAAYNAQEKRIKEEKAWINKFRDKQPVAVKQREAKLEKLMSSKDYVQKPPFVGKPFKFRFPDAPRLSPEVAEIMELTHGYGNNRLFDKVELFIAKGDRIAVVGPNGSGKSTLLRFLMGKEQPDGGSAELVGLNVVANYFEQNQADVLDLDLTVSETIQRASNGQSYNELRALLGQFLFKGDAVDKKVGSLSGGEKARLSLCTMMLRPANVLILGELKGTTIALLLLCISLFSSRILFIPPT